MANHKIIILGDEYVGKETLNRSFKDYYDNGHVVEESGFEKYIFDTVSCEIEIWRSSKYHTYYQITEEVLAQIHGIILVYDIARSDTFYHLAYWMDTISHSIGINVPVVIVGNKLDERHWGNFQADVVSSSQGMEFVHQIADTYKREIPYFEVCAYRSRVPKMILDKLMPRICEELPLETVE